MIPELGHYALMLALGLALIQGIMPIVGTRTQRSGADEHRRAGGAGAIRLRRHRVFGARRMLRRLRFLGAQCLREFQFGDAADLPAHQHLGQSRRLDDAVGVDPGVLRRAGRAVRHQSAGDAQGQCARRAGLDRGRLSSVHSDHVESVPAHRRCAVRGPRSQSDPARPGPRVPSADALPRLCRLLDRVLLRHCRPDRRPHRRGLGALGAAVGAWRLDVPDARHRRRLVLGLLRARLGRLLVLGPGRECVADAVARRHGAVAFRRGHGKARRAQSLDHPARHHRVLAVADRHLPGALGRAHFGARLRHRSDARHFHPRHSRRLHRRRAGALRLARAVAQTGRPVRADLARGRAGLQQSVPDVGLCDRFRRHALSAGARSFDRRQDFRRPAVLQRDLRPAVHSADAGDAVRAAARLEARRYRQRGATPARRRGAGRRRRRRRLCHRARRPGAGAVRSRASRSSSWPAR